MVNYKWALLFFVAFLTAATGCNRADLPEPLDSDPVFRLQGNLEGEGFDLAAGVEQYFMYTAFTPVNDGNFRSLSRLEELGCTTGCAPSWQFEFNGSLAAVDSFFAPGSISFIQPGSISVDTIYKLSLAARSNHSAGGSALSHEWSFFDGSTVNTATVEKEIPGPGLYEVELTTITEEDCLSYTRKNFSFASPLPGCEVDFYVDTTLIFDSIIVANYLPGSSQPELLLWQDSIPGEVISFLFPELEEPVTICLEGLFPQGCSAITCQTVILAQGASAGSVCSNAIEGGVVIETDSTVASGLSNGVVVRYVDELGNVYASDTGEQTGVVDFTIETVGPFEENSQGQATLELGIRFQCQLFDAQGQPWRQAEGNGTIAVAVPD